MAGCVYLVGAGPGDPGLLTRRGADVLASADVVAYDRLVHPDLLRLAPHAELVDVGKVPGQSASGQARINELLVDRARGGERVVRLKGGDPFVFGRGGEEAELCAEAGVAFEVVPGITSAVAAPAYAGIPLTHRDHASWVALATGHEDPTKPVSGLDWDALASAPTAVFLMGIKQLDEIAGKLTSAGRDPATPVAVVAWGTWPRQRVLTSTLDRVADAVREAGIGPPAVLVVGDVTTLSARLGWFTKRPLLGRRVFVTRTRAQTGRLAAALGELGAEVLEFPAIRVEPPTSFDPLDDALTRLADHRWVVFTSTNAVEAVFDRLIGLDARAFASNEVAAVGPATAEALREKGLLADLVPEVATTAALVETLGGPPPGSGTGLLYPTAEEAPSDAADALSALGWEVEVVPAYRTETDTDSVDAGKAAIDEGVDAVLFTSGSTARNFVELWGPPPTSALICCIGPRTAEAAEAAGLRVDAVATEHTIDGLVACLLEAVGG